MLYSGRFLFFNCQRRDYNTIEYAVDGGNIYFDSESGTVTGSDLYITAVTIPEKINNVEVKVIGKEAFYYRSELKQVKISGNITEIGESAFKSCYNLSVMTLPSTIETIGKSAFGSDS